MTTTMQLTAELILAGKDISARAGDRLMIVNGVCVGVYTGKEQERTVQPTDAQIIAPTYVRKKTKRQPRSEDVHKQRTETDRNVYTILTNQQEAITQRKVKELMGIDIKKDDFYLRQSIYRLIRDGVIHAEGHSAARVYRIVDHRKTTNSYSSEQTTTQGSTT